MCSDTARPAAFDTGEEQPRLTLPFATFSALVAGAPLLGGERACLRVLRSQQPRLLNQTFPLSADRVRVGRLVENDWVLRDELSVSGLHAELRRDGDAWSIRDLNSTNGTRINGEPLPTREQRLTSGDRITMGDVVVEFVEARIPQLSSESAAPGTDELTGLPRKDWLLGLLQATIDHGRRSHASPGVVMIKVGRLADINAAYGWSVGDELLRSVANVLRSQVEREHFLGRYAGENFLVILPETSEPQCGAVARALGRTLHEWSWLVQGQAIRLPVAVGAAVAAADETALALVDAALNAAWRASRRGGAFAVTEAWREQTERFRWPRAADLVLQMGGELGWGALIAFEIEQESAVVHDLGSEVREQWFNEIGLDAGQLIDPEDGLGTWGNRYVLVALARKRADQADEIAARIRTVWTERPLSASYGGEVRRALCCTILREDEMQPRARLLDVLVGRLGQATRVSGTSNVADALPFPLVACRPVIAAQPNMHGRALALIDALERALRFVVAVETAALRESRDVDVRQRGAEVVARKPPGPSTMGTWQTLVWQLAAALPPNAAGPIAVVRDAFATRQGGPSALSITLQRAVETRNRVVHDAPRDPQIYQRVAAPLQQAFDAVLSALQPMVATPLVSLDSGRGFVSATRVGYSLRHHAGMIEPSPLIDVELPIEVPIQGNWCYLLGPEGVPPLLLAPMVAATVCPQCERVEVFLGEELLPAPGRDAVALHGAKTDHKTRLTAPFFSAEAMDFHARARG